MRKTTGDDHWEIGRIKTELGATLTATGEFPEAEKLLLKGYDTLAADIEVQTDVLSEARDRVVALYDAWNRPDDARRWAERSLRR